MNGNPIKGIFVKTQYLAIAEFVLLTSACQGPAGPQGAQGVPGISGYERVYSIRVTASWLKGKLDPLYLDYRSSTNVRQTVYR